MQRSGVERICKCTKIYHQESLVFFNMYDSFYLFYKSLVPESSNQNSEHIEILTKEALRKMDTILVALRLYHMYSSLYFFIEV